MPPDTAENPYAAPAFHPEEIAAPLSGHYAFTRNPRRLTNVLTTLLVLFLLKNLFYFIDEIAPLGGVRSWEIPFLPTLNTGISLATVVTFCVWTYRAVANSRGFGARGMKDSPGQAVLWYFIPVANLFRPYQTMKQIWQISGNPEDWKNQPGSPILSVWWALWIIHFLYAYLSTFAQLQALLPLSHFWNGLVVTVLYTAVTLAAIFLVRAITRRQEALVAASAE